MQTMFRCYCCLQEEVAWVDLNFEFNFFYEHMGERGEGVGKGREGNCHVLVILI